MIYGSLFTGIGGLDLAVEHVFGATTAWQCEIDPFCRRVLAKHWPGVTCYEDVTQARPPKGASIVCGGFPCQDVSCAGKGAGITGKRSCLWREFARIIRDVGPRYVVVENVTSGLSRWLPFVLADLDALGFDAEWETVLAAHVGAPHLRARTFVLGYAHGDRQSTLGVDGEASRLRSATGCSAGVLSDANEGGALPPGWTATDAAHCQGFPPLYGDVSGWAEWVGPEPGIPRGHDGIPHRLDRIAALGNAVCHQQAILALRRMIARLP